MSRSRYKFSYVNKYFWKYNLGRYKFKYFNQWRQHYVFSKSSVILPCFQKKYIFLHKGHFFKYLRINQSMIGFRFGEFISTRKPFFFPLKTPKKKKKK